MKKIFTSHFLVACIVFFMPLGILAQSSNADHIIEVKNNFYDPEDIIIQLGETVRWVNIAGTHNVNGSLDAYPDNPEHFFSGPTESGNWEFEHTFNTLGSYTYHCDDHFTLGMIGNITVVNNPTYMLVNMSQLRENDADGVPVLNEALVEVLGTVYGTNLRPQGLQFTIIDGNNKGVGIFNASGNLSYEPTEGDLIRVWGQVSFFNGLTQIEPDSIEWVSDENPLVDPEIVTDLGEETESSLIMLEEVTITNPEDWPNPGQAANIFVENTHGTFLMRIPSEVDLGNTPPNGPFDLIGIGGQFTTNIPADDGYQLLPRYASDIGIEEIEYSVVDIPALRQNNIDFEPVLLGEKVQTTAVVYGINLRPQGLEFTIIDSENNGVGVFRATGNLDYEVKEGDRITVRGTVGQFRGLTQITADEIDLVSSDNSLIPAITVNILDEATESSLVRIPEVTLLNPEDWPAPGTAANLQVENIDGIFEVRVPAAVILGFNPPAGHFDLTGIGSQFTTNIPPNDGYRVVPRYAEDMGLDISDPYMQVTMPELRENDQDGRPVLLGQPVSVTAVVYGINYRPQGLQFTLIDANNVGIGVFRASGSLDYEVNEGDLITLKGVVSEFRGLSQINAEEIEFIEADQPLVEPRVVNELNESTESRLVRLEGVNIQNSSQWVSEGSEGNVTLERNGETFVLRIQRESRLGNEAPEGLLNITGIGTQFTTAVPANDGYQIVPRYTEDIEMVSNTIDFSSGLKISVWPNPAADLLHFESNSPVVEVILFDLSGKMVLQHENINGIKSLDISNERSGQYLLMIKTETESGVVPIVIY
ncbi:MAG: T9SS C-terminal target domain-containing protein [Saprospirales bacterium]|nr:MAG: T9SS C-terminal target domain-containing protein [Saprospirales bacterium]